MAIYYCAIDRREKKRIEPPNGFANNSPGIYHPTNPFPGMVIMMNIKGCDFDIIDDTSSEYELACTYEDITQQVYNEYLSIWNK